MSEYHIPVMLNECVEGLEIKSGGIYVDATFGGGGHSKAILKKIGNGKLIAFDQDADAEMNITKDERFVFIRHNFRFMKNFLEYLGIQKVDGILADLGVSWHQFDDAGRGFSFRHDAQLDMRMNNTASTSAQQVVNEYDIEKLKKIFYEFGELHNAAAIASAICRVREREKITTTTQLIRCLSPLIPKKREHKFLAKVFQAIRIEVNNEMEALRELLVQAADLITAGGRLVVISYHSLEDTMVKHFLRAGNFSGIPDKDIYGNVIAPFRPAQNKALVPSGKEIALNNRARSAKLRIGIKN